MRHHPLLIAAVSLACSGDVRRDDRYDTRVDTLGSVVHVRNGGEPPVWTLSSVVRIGSTEDDAAGFGRIRSLTADARGNVYVADNAAQEIRVFARDGRHLRTIGRRGAGPGEFGDLYSLAWLGERLAVMDPRNARIALLTTEGGWTAEIRHYTISGPASLVRLHPLGSSGFYTPVAAGRGSGGLPFVRITVDGSGDTIRVPPRPESARQTGAVCHRPDGGVTGIAVPDAPALVYGFPASGGSIAVSWTEDYRISVLNQAGDTLRVVTRQLEPIAYSDATWERAMEPYHTIMRDYPGTRCEPAEPDRPAARSALRHILFDETGRMWVEAAATEGFAWEIYDAEGRLLGRTAAPQRSAGVPPYVRDGHLYQVETDSLDVQYVGVYRLQPS